MNLEHTKIADSNNNDNSDSRISPDTNDHQAETTSTKPVTESETDQSNLLSQLPIGGDTLLFGLNFKYTKVAKKGLINRLKRNTQTLDIDISCLLFDEKISPVDAVWFKQLRDQSEAIRHQGDSLNGRDRGDLPQIDRNADMETIELRLSRLPESVHHVALLLSSYYDYPIRYVERGNLYLSDDEGNEVYTSDLTLLTHNASAICIALLSRELGEWRLTIQDLTLNSPDMQKMTEEVQRELSRLYA